MLPFQVRRFKGQSRGRKGEDVVVLTDRRGSPDLYYYPNLFATNEYRQTRKSSNTIEKVLRTIGMTTTWGTVRGRNLDEELSAGRFLDAADIIDLARFLSLSSADQTAEYRTVLPDTVVAPLRSAKSKGKPKRDADLGKAEYPYDDVPAEEVGKRIRWAARYFEWHRRRRFDNRKLSEIEERLNTTAASAITDLRNKAPSSPGDYSDAELLEAPDLALLQRIEQIMQPGSADNPFRSAFVQSRNYLAWRIFADVPVRRGEVFTARTDSIDPSKHQFLVRISKTRARTVPISRQTVAAFERFFDDHWRNLPDDCPAHRTGELFTNQQGAPLTHR